MVTSSNSSGGTSLSTKAIAVSQPSTAASQPSTAASPPSTAASPPSTAASPLSTTASPPASALWLVTEGWISFDALQAYPVNAEANICNPEYIEEDKNIPGSFVYIDGNSLRLTDGSKSQPFVGQPLESGRTNGTGTDASFNTISSFLQHGDDAILIADSGNNCIRRADRSTKYVSTFIGSCKSNRVDSDLRPNKEEPSVKRGYVRLRSPKEITYRSDENLFYIINYSSMNVSVGSIITLNTQTNESRVFFSAADYGIARMFHMIWSNDYRHMFISHKFGISQFDVSTHQLRTVAGSGPAGDGSFSDVRLSSDVGILKWIIPDRILILADNGNNSLVVLNLIENSSADISLSKTTSAMFSAHCTPQKNNAASVFVVNNTVYTSTKADNMFYKANFYLPECYSPENPDSLTIVPVKYTYDLGDEIHPQCPENLTFTSLYYSTTCIHNTTEGRPQGAWSNGLPTCGEPYISNVFPLEGSLGGGTLVTAAGAFPNWTIVQVDRDGLVVNLTVTGNFSVIQFRLPDATQTQNATIVIRLSPLNSRVETWNYQYRPNPSNLTPYNKRFTRSGGQTLRLGAHNLITSSHYQLYLKRRDYHPVVVNCTSTSSEVDCTLPPLVQLNKTGTLDDGNLPSCNISHSPTLENETLIQDAVEVNIGLIVDLVCVSVTDGISILYYPDPTFNQSGRQAIELSSKALITFQGERLNLINRSSYTIRFPDLHNSTCEIKSLTSDLMICKPNISEVSEYLRLQTGHSSLSPKISIETIDGSELKYSFEPGYVKFTLWDPPPTTRSITNRAAIQEYWWIIAFLSLVSILCFIGFLYWSSKRRRRNRFDQSADPSADPSAESAESADILIDQSNIVKPNAPVNKGIVSWLKELDSPTAEKLEKTYISPQDLIWNLNSPAIGKGQFGNVMMGRLKVKTGEDFVLRSVAVKMLKATFDIDRHMIEKFIREALFMYSIPTHVNVLEVLGVVWPPEDCPVVVLPYMAHGDLSSLLKSNQKLTLGDMLHFAMQIACGMEHLSSQSLVHRDLACRNCLVDQNWIVKVADFGMSKDTYEDGYYRESSRKRLRPVRWMAVESLKEYKYSTQSDVWSFGVVLWELFTRGSTPYAEIKNSDILDFLSDGNRLEKPAHIKPELYQWMCLRCWNGDPDLRPTFAELHSVLKRDVAALPRNLGAAIQEDDESYSGYEQNYTKLIPHDYTTDKTLIQISADADSHKILFADNNNFSVERELNIISSAKSETLPETNDTKL